MLILNRSRVKTFNSVFFSFLFFSKGWVIQIRMVFCYSLVNSNKNIYSLIRKTVNQQTEKCETSILKKILAVSYSYCSFFIKKKHSQDVRDCWCWSLKPGPPFYAEAPCELRAGGKWRAVHMSPQGTAWTVCSNHDFYTNPVAERITCFLW